MGIMKVYLAGKITGDQEYKEKFQHAGVMLRQAGYVVINPAILPDGLEYNDYMHICTAMIDVADAVCFLPDWKESAGAKFEYGHAAAAGILIAMFNDFLETGRVEPLE